MYWLRKYLKDRKEARSLSREQIRAEANIGNNFISIVQAWSSLSKDCDNKTEWNNFAKYVLSEIEKYNDVIREEK